MEKKQIECTKAFLKKYLDSLITALCDCLHLDKNEFEKVTYHPNNISIILPPSDSVVAGEQQVINDCSVKGHWALLEKLFRRLNISDCWEPFKKRTEKAALTSLEAITPEHDLLHLSAFVKPQSWPDNMDFSKISSYTLQEVYSICWSSFFQQNEKQINYCVKKAKLVPLSKRWKYYLVKLPMVYPHPIWVKLEDLLGEKERVVIGSDPVKSPTFSPKPRTRICTLCSPSSKITIPLSMYEITANEKGWVTFSQTDHESLILKPEEMEWRLEGNSHISWVGTFGY